MSSTLGMTPGRIWSAQEDQIVADAMLRNEGTKSIATHLPGRTRNAIGGRTWSLYGAGVRKGADVKILPRNWTTRQQRSIPSYTLEEDKELVRWRCNGCAGLNGRIFDDSQSKESMRSRIAVLEKESKTLSDMDRAEITRLVQECQATDPTIDWESVSASVETRIGRRISASLCMATWYFVVNKAQRVDHPLYKPFCPRRGITRQLEPEGNPRSSPGVIRNDPTLAKVLRLNYTENERQAYVDGVKTVYLKRLPLMSEYPPRNEWICENQTIRDIWEEPMTTGPLDDVRTARKGLHNLDFKQLQYVVELDESVRLLDVDSGELIAEIRRAFVPDTGVLTSINSMAERNLGLRRNVRRDDPGSIVQTGYTAGSKDLRSFVWARSLITRLTEEEIRELNYTTSSAYALFWNMVRNSVPETLIEDFNGVIRQSGMPRMDSNLKGRKPDLRYKVETGGRVFEFTYGELAPPCGVCGGNYSRQGTQSSHRTSNVDSLVRYTHNEKNATKNILSLTTHRSLPSDAGGNFYSSSYAFLVRSQANTLVTHRVADFHGTTLAQVTPGEKNLYQTGISILIQGRLPAAWKEYQKGKSPDVTEALELEMATEEDEVSEGDEVKKRKRD
ncbi:MAG: hypothetical protein M1836_002898 [Candelina mexicana]|nr:MAG: hypothetical protein M1836_002898 [Candelina mexicana]